MQRFNITGRNWFSFLIILAAYHYCLNTLQNKQNFGHIVINLECINVKQVISVYVDCKVCFTVSYGMLCGR